MTPTFAADGGRADRELLEARSEEAGRYLADHAEGLREAGWTVTWETATRSRSERER